MLRVAKVVGLNSDTDAALAFISRPRNLDLESGEVVFRLYLIISTSVDDAFSQTRQAISEAENIFYSSSGAAKDCLGEVIRVVRSSLGNVEKLGIIAAISEEQPTEVIFYLQHLGSDVRASLFRQGKKNDLCQLAADSHLVSGKLKDGDRVVLVIGEESQILESDFENLDNFSLEEWEEEIEAKLPQTQAYQLASIVIENEPEEVKEIELLNEHSSITKSDEKSSPARLILMVKDIVIPSIHKIVRSKKGLTVAGVVILIIVLAIMGLNLKHQKSLKVGADFGQKFNKAAEEYQKAIAFKDLDPLASSQSLTSAEQYLGQALKVKPEDSQALNLQKQIKENSGTILKAFEVKDLAVWLDLGLVKKDFHSENLALSLGKLLVLDSQKDVLVKIDLSTKAPQLLAGSDKLGDAKASSLNGSVAWVLSTDKGLINMDTSSNKVTIAVKTDPEWGEIMDLYGFAGNVYLLDKGNPSTRSTDAQGRTEQDRSTTSSGQIWKYLPVESGYSDKRNYLKDTVPANFTGAKKLQIDSSVWVLSSDGKILKFTQGSADHFSISGIKDEVKDVSSFFLSDQTSNLYLLDRGNKRLLITDKQGAYKAQYFGDNFSSFEDLVVDEENRKVYLLRSNKIYLLELK